jgi:Flp pilus assembly protein TadG
MRTVASRPELIARIASFARDRRGVSAVEFAMLLPLMVTLYLGVVEVSTGVAIDRKVTLTTRTMADLASRVTSINNADMTNMLNATSAVIAPYDQSKVKVVLSAVNIDANGVAKVSWSDTLHGSARSVGSTVTVPTVLAVPNTTLIWSEVSYNYNPTFGYVLTGNMNLNDQIYMRPRLSDTITRVNS